MAAQLARLALIVLALNAAAWGEGGIPPHLKEVASVVAIDR